MNTTLQGKSKKSISIELYYLYWHHGPSLPLNLEVTHNWVTMGGKKVSIYLSWKGGLEISNIPIHRVWKSSLVQSFTHMEMVVTGPDWGRLVHVGLYNSWGWFESVFSKTGLEPVRTDLDWLLSITVSYYVKEMVMAAWLVINNMVWEKKTPCISSNHLVHDVQQTPASMPTYSNRKGPGSSQVAMERGSLMSSKGQASKS